MFIIINLDIKENVHRAETAHILHKFQLFNSMPKVVFLMHWFIGYELGGNSNLYCSTQALSQNLLQTGNVRKPIKLQEIN